MDRVFSVEEISDQFWTQPPQPWRPKPEESAKMNRSDSEWAFQRFLQEAAVNKAGGSSAVGEDRDVIEIKDTTAAANLGQEASNVNYKNKVNAVPTSAPPPNIPVDSDDYQAFLKSKLNLACAAVALSRASYVIPHGSTAATDVPLQVSKNPQLGSQAPSKAVNYIPKQQDDDVAAAPPLTSSQKKTVFPLKSTTSGSDQSDDDEADGETAGTDSAKPADAKRVRRMLSNRESARRSRRRKQAHMSELETQVGQLRVENSTLVKRLSNVSKKFNESAVDNRVLKADVETLRAKVKMAEETMKRLTGLNPFFHTLSEMSTMSGVLKFDSSSETSSDASVPVQDDANNRFYQSGSGNPVSSAHGSGVNNGIADVSVGKMRQTGSMQRVASLEHLQKRICRDFPSNGEL